MERSTVSQNTSNNEPCEKMENTNLLTNNEYSDTHKRREMDHYPPWGTISLANAYQLIEHDK